MIFFFIGIILFQLAQAICLGSQLQTPLHFVNTALISVAFTLSVKLACTLQARPRSQAVPPGNEAVPPGNDAHCAEMI